MYPLTPSSIGSPSIGWRCCRLHRRHGRGDDGVLSRSSARSSNGSSAASTNPGEAGRKELSVHHARGADALRRRVRGQGAALHLLPLRRCASPAGSGGETTFCDTTKLLSRGDRPRASRKLAGRRASPTDREGGSLRRSVHGGSCSKGIRSTATTWCDTPSRSRISTR